MALDADQEVLRTRQLLRRDLCSLARNRPQTENFGNAVIDAINQAYSKLVHLLVVSNGHVNPTPASQMPAYEIGSLITKPERWAHEVTKAPPRDLVNWITERIVTRVRTAAFMLDVQKSSSETIQTFVCALLTGMMEEYSPVPPLFQKMLKTSKLEELQLEKSKIGESVNTDS